jgi:hypothetical protein
MGRPGNQPHSGDEYGGEGSPLDQAGEKLHISVTKRKYESNSERRRGNLTNLTVTSLFPSLAKATLCWSSTLGGD